MPDIVKPDPNTKITITVNDSEVPLFMSFGLLNALLERFQGSAAGIEDAIKSPDGGARYALIAFLLQKRGAKSGMEVVPAADDLDISSADVGKITEWMLDNVTDFFLTQAVAAQRTAEKYKATADSLAPLAIGSEG